MTFQQLVHSGFAELAEIRADIALDAARGIDHLPIGVRDGLREALTRKAADLMWRTVVGEFQVWRDDNGFVAHADRSDALDAFFREHAERATVLELLERWPVLDIGLTACLDRVIDNTVEIVEAFAADRAALGHLGVTPESTVAKISHGMGDSHNQGRTVAIVTLDTGRKLVFKPRSSACDDLAERIVECVSDAVPSGLGQVLPRRAGAGTHHWQELVSAEDLQDGAAVARYFERFGALTCLMSALGANDLHHENVMACGEWPVVVDGETLLQPVREARRDTFPHVITQRYDEAPTRTLMVPMYMSNSAFDILISAAGVPWEQESRMNTFVMVNGASDDCRVERSTFSMVHESNVVTLRGERVNPASHYEQILSGFQSMRSALTSVADEVMEIIMAARNVDFRVVLRPTDIYIRYLDAATHPRRLASFDAAESLLDLLQTPMPGSPAETFALERERSAMRRWDVPLFTVDIHGHALRADGELSSRCLEFSPAEEACRRLGQLQQTSGMFDRHVLESSLGELAIDRTTLAEHSQYRELLTLPAEKAAQRYSTLLRSLATWGETMSGEPGVLWMGSTGQPQGSTLDAFATSVHDLGGICAFLTNAGTDSALAMAARAAWQEADSARSADAVLLSATAGPASALMIGGEANLEPTLRSLDELGNDDPRPDAVDLMLGAAGLCLLFAGTPNPDTDLVERALRPIRDTSRVRWERPDFDLAHGQLGVLWGRHRAASVLGDVALEEQAADELRGLVIRSARAKGIGSAWCSGAAGLLTVVADLAGAGFEIVDSGTVDRLAEQACVLSPGAPVDVSLCHGMSGTVNALLAAGVAGVLPGGVEAAHGFFDSARQRALNSGFQTGAPGRTAVLGYFLGWSGYADVAARLSEGSPTPLTSIRPIVPTKQRILT